MDRDLFDRLSRLVATAGSRRDALRLLVAGAIAGAAGANDPALARKRRGQRRARGRLRAEQVVPLPPCALQDCINCANKKLQGGANLSRCDFNQRDLKGVKLGGSNVSKACFGGANLRSALFRGANVAGACFCAADLTGADFRGSNVTQAQLACAHIECGANSPCPKGLTCCNGLCADLKSNPRNCGACGKRCQVESTCEQGVCTCLGGGGFPCNDPDFSCCGADDPQDICICTLVISGKFSIPGTCGQGPCDPPGVPCVGPVCQACCPPRSTCDPTTGTCLQ